MGVTTGVSAIVSAALIITENIKQDKIGIIIKHNPHIFADIQHCWQHYISHPHCQPVFPIRAFFN
jgi:hypothetical protein